jgi:hypothetical protein
MEEEEEEEKEEEVSSPHTAIRQYIEIPRSTLQASTSQHYSILIYMLML